MHTTSRSLWLHTCVCLAAVAIVPIGAGAAPPAADGLLPETTLATLTLRDGPAQVERLRDSALLARLTESENWKTVSEQPELLKARGALYFFAGSMSMDPWGVLGHSLGRETTLALVPRGKSAKDPAAVALIQPAEPAAAERLLDALLAATGATSGGEPVESRSRMVDGVRGFQLTPELFAARWDGLIALANHAETLERLVRERESSGGKLGGVEVYRKARAAAPRDASAWAFVNIHQLREFDRSGFEKRLDNALAATLFGGLTRAAQSAQGAALWIETARERFTLTGRLIGVDMAKDVLRPFATAAGLTKDWGKLELPHGLGEWSVARDWSGLWEAREGLLSADGLRDLLGFASILTTLMGNLDFSSELLPELGPTLRLVAARQEFAGDPPTPQIPAFALLLPLKDAARLGPKLENAGLMTLSVINVDAGQKMRPQYQIQMETYQGVRLVSGSFPPVADAGPRNVRYNLAPTLALIGDQYVIGTTRGIVQQIADAYGKLPAADATSGPAPDALRIDLRELHRTLDVNRELLVTNQMIEKDLPREKAAAQVGLLLDGLALLKELSLTLAPQEGEYALRAEVTMNAER